MLLSESANDLAKQLQAHIENGRLIIDPRAIPIVARCFMVDIHKFMESINRICTLNDTQITLYPDGMIDELSFGILWHRRQLNWEMPNGTKVYKGPKTDERAYMVGGLIYRGPERHRPSFSVNLTSTDHQPQHEWSVHT